MNTEQFLSAVLPTKGNYFLALPFTTSKGYKHLPFTDTTLMADQAIKMSDKGINTFFACASYETPSYTVTKDGKEVTKYRTGDNAQYAKSQWLDLDGDQKKNLVQLNGFLQETGLPNYNILVNSGNGLHVYWTFEQDVPKEKWRTVASTFKAICAHYKLGQEDTSRTADVASIMRPVGTNNDKTKKGLGIKAVKLVGTPNETPILFADWVRHLARIKKELGLSVTAPSSAPVNTMNDDLGGGMEFRPTSAAIIAEKCNQIREFRDRKGVGQSEPLWRKCLGILKFTTDGQELAQEWSSEHPSYDPEDTQDKLDNWNAGPASCASFKDANPLGCEGCQYKVKSPILLGEIPPVAITEYVYENAEGETVVEPVRALPPRFGTDFIVSDRGLSAVEQREDGGARTHLLCEAVPLPVEYYQDTDDDQWKITFKARIKAGVYNQAKFDLKTIGQGGSALLGALAGNLCITVLPGKVRLMEKYMHTWIEEIRREADETAMHTHMGWYDDGSFLLGDQKYMPNGDVKKVMLKAAIRKVADRMVPVGDFERYKVLIDKAYNRPNHEAYQFTWLAGFGSVLLNIIHPEPIGIVFDSFSGKSGFGKSSVAKLATGIWGHPAIISAQGTTEYALYLNAGMRHNLPIVLDETTPWDGKKLGESAYQYSLGIAKEQGKADGGLRDNSHVNWNNIMFTNGNTAMSERIAGAFSNPAPQMARVWEYEFTAGHRETLDKHEGPEVMAELMTIYGVAGIPFIQYVVKNRAALKIELDRMAVKMLDESGLLKDARYWKLGAAVTMVAERITRELGMHSFDQAALMSWVIVHLKAMGAASKDSVADLSYLFGDMMAALQGGFIVTNKTGDRRGEPAHFSPGFGAPRGEITGRVIVEEQVVYISVAAMSNWCKDHDCSPRDMKQVIKEKGWYKGESTFRLGTGTLIALPPTGCIRLDWKLFGSGVNLVPEFEPLKEAV